MSPNLPRLLAVFWLCVMLAEPVSAATREGPQARAQEALQKAKTDQETLEKKRAELAQKAQAAQTELETLQKQMVTVAEEFEASEKQLRDYQDKLKILESQEKEKRARLALRKQQYEALAMAATRLAQVPVQSAVLMPGEFSRTLKAGIVMGSISSSIRDQARRMEEDMIELQSLTGKIQKQGKTVQAQRVALTRKRQDLEKQLTERKRLQAKIAQDQATTTRNAEELAKKSTSLQDLVGQLQEQEEQKEQKEQTKPKSKVSGKLRSFAKAKGAIRQPVIGKVIREFGVALNSNDTTRGITFETEDLTQVRAPFDGEVVFVGNFMNYGPMVILRHSDDFHTLIAGIGRIDVSTGQTLLEGEPIGAMRGDRAGTRLYMEVRQHNQPIDPAPWLKTP